MPADMFDVVIATSALLSNLGCLGPRQNVNISLNRSDYYYQDLLGYILR